MQIEDLNLINREIRGVMFRATLFTQSLYCVACLITFSFVRVFFRPEWMKFVYWGAWFLVLFGFYDWAFYAVFHADGNFLNNRTFGLDDHPGSWLQPINIGPVTLMRLKSFTGEPSMFSVVAMPYFVLAFVEKKQLLASALLAALVLSTSTSAYVALLFCAGLFALFTRRLSWQIVLLGFTIMGVVGISYFLFPDTFRALFSEKLAGEGDSGGVRSMWIKTHLDFFFHAPVLNQLFGIGFGYIYDVVSVALLVNTGLFGLLIYLAGFLRPTLSLSSRGTELGLKCALLVILFLYSISVTELFYPTTWLFLGLAYWTLDEARRARRSPARLEKRKFYTRRQPLPLAA